MVSLIKEYDNRYQLKTPICNIILLKSKCNFAAQATTMLLTNLNNIQNNLYDIKKLYKNSTDIYIAKYNIGVIYQILYSINPYSPYSEDNIIQMKKYYTHSISIPEAANNLGYYYGTQFNNNKALYYWKLAYDMGNASAAHNLGNYYYVDKNYNLMKEYLLESVERKSIGGTSLLGKYYYEINDITQAKIYFNIAINLGGVYSYIWLAMCYLYEFDTNLAGQEIAKYIVLNKDIRFNYSKFINLLNLGQYNSVSHVLVNFSIEDLNKFYHILGDAAKVAFLSAHKNKIDVQQIVNNCKLYSLMAEFKNLLNDGNKIKFDAIEQLSCNEEECDICCISKETITLPCHISHTICKSCFMQIGNCPYCNKVL
jgi:tetratricopeptide (TPR) repeat protein